MVPGRPRPKIAKHCRQRRYETLFRIRTYKDLDSLPDTYATAFEQGEAHSFYLTIPWYQCLARTVLDPSEEARIYVAEHETESTIPVGLMATRCTGAGGKRFAARRLSGLSNFYSMEYAPVVRPTVVPYTGIVDSIIAEICREEPPWDILDFDPVHRDSPSFSALVGALCKARMFVYTYYRFGMRYEVTAGKTSAAYMQERPSFLLNTYRRKLKKLKKEHEFRFELTTGEPGLERAMADYERIYSSSWKAPENYPEFIPTLMRTCAQAGSLRLGLIYVDGEPAAAQLWIVGGGRATIYKLAYDERFAPLSVGTILTVKLMEHVIDVDRVHEVDFGSGDQSYKKEWLPRRREYWGIMAFNPRTVRGVLAAIREYGGWVLAQAIRRSS